MADFDENSIEFYKKYYGERLSFDGKVYKYTHSEKEIEVAGDVCFNLNLKNGKFYTLYGSIIKDEECFDNLDKNLQELRYAPMNISIMPKTGGLNNLKKWYGNDRFDTFASLLKYYYDGNKVPVINGGAINMNICQRLKLDGFLDGYSSVYDYFYDIYGIERGFTDDLVKAGSRLITTKEEMYKYINIALEFWNNRINQERINEYIDKEAMKNYSEKMSEIERIILECANS